MQLVPQFSSSAGSGFPEVPRENTLIFGFAALNSAEDTLKTTNFFMQNK